MIKLKILGLFLTLLTGCCAPSYVGQLQAGFSLQDFNNAVARDNLLTGITAKTLTQEYYLEQRMNGTRIMAGKLVIIYGAASEVQMQYFVNTYSVLTAAGKIP